MPPRSKRNGIRSGRRWPPPERWTASAQSPSGGPTCPPATPSRNSYSNASSDSSAIPGGRSSRFSFSRYSSVLHLLQHREDVARRVLEPGDRGAGAAGDALLVLFETLVALEADAALGEPVDGGLDVVDLEVEDGVGGGLVVGLAVDECVATVAELQRHHAELVAQHLGTEAERVGVEGPRLVEVVDGEAVGGFGGGEHLNLLFSRRARGCGVRCVRRWSHVPTAASANPPSGSGRAA